MHFQHDDAVWRDFPELVPGTILAEGITPGASVDEALRAHHAAAAERLAAGPESGLPEIQAWRRAFSRMGLKPTQYRCASESLLRRFKKEGALPRIHPLIDLCNAVSVAFAIPVAVFDLSRVDGFLEVRRATGQEEYVTLAGEREHPEPGEVIFADGGGHAHARRWTNRQSGLSAVRDTTASVLIVAEALHPTAAEDVRKLTEVLSGELSAAWGVTPAAAVLGPSSPRLEF
ncbi:B3/4 domain-containing protein [Nonomuraea sp. ATR24]|uniref:B3/B4 domain-containing protein n=1 Tax=unclassified Nonomuraea TaxID=2593643 RepID=UPI0033DDD253